MFSLLLGLIFLTQKGNDDLLAKYREKSIATYEKAILQLEEIDRKEKDPIDPILFIGSSSIRLWESIEADLKPWPVIRRGFGGSRFHDVAVYAPRLLRPHAYRALVIYVGNDITGSENDKTPEEILALFQRVVEESKAHRPQAKIFLIAITPTEKRWSVWKETKMANAVLKKYCESSTGVHFIETENAYLNQEGKPKSEYFREDKLHQNSAGYGVWSGLIRSSLEKELGKPTR